MADRLKAIGKGMGSWKTTAAGVFAAVAAWGSALSAVLDNSDATQADWNVVGVATAVAIGLIMSRDNDVTSEEAKAGK